VEVCHGHDLDTAASYLVEDVVFDGPASHSTGKTAYLEGLNGFAQRVTGVTLLAALGDDRQALIMYEVTTPAGPLTCAEHLTVCDGKIQTDRLTFAARTVPTA
jgi:hypothetical protein